MALQDQEARQTKAPEPQSVTSTRGMERAPWTSGPLGRGAPAGGIGPFSLMRQLGEDMDRLFGELFEWGTKAVTAWSTPDLGAWPEIEVHHAGNKLVIEADVPGLKKEDVNVEVRDQELSISGERRSEFEKKEDRYYRTERSYGSFRRTLPLPEGAKPETASATFENGVLKIEMEAPGGEAQGRRIEVRQGGEQ